MLEINLYDLSIELLQAREGSSEGSRLWEKLDDRARRRQGDSLLELLQNVLGIEDYLIPAIASAVARDRLRRAVPSGIGEVSLHPPHNVLNNLQSTAKDKPTVLFFPRGIPTLAGKRAPRSNCSGCSTTTSTTAHSTSSRRRPEEGPDGTNRIFRNPVSRPIEGVIKADDESSSTQSSARVRTHRRGRQAPSSISMPTTTTTAPTGYGFPVFRLASHLLKMLAAAGKPVVDGSSALGNLPTQDLEGRYLLRAALKRAVAIPRRAFCSTSTRRRTSSARHRSTPLLSVFVKVFNEMRLLRQEGLLSLRFERDLDSRDQFEAFKKPTSGSPASRGNAVGNRRCSSPATSPVPAPISPAKVPSMAKGIYDKYRAQYSVSIEDFATRSYVCLDKKPANFRLNFFVDEVGQYIAETPADDQFADGGRKFHKCQGAHGSSSPPRRT